MREALRGTLGTAKDDAQPVPGAWRDRWRALAELGMTGFCVPEEKGGSSMTTGRGDVTDFDFTTRCQEGRP